MKEHVTEYGVHWNFFITLGLLPPFVTILRVSKPKAVPYSTFALLTMLAYEWALYHVPFRSYDNILTFIVSGQRSDLFSQNREGIFSFLGSSLEIATNQRLSVDISCWIRCW